MNHTVAYSRDGAIAAGSSFVVKAPLRLVEAMPGYLDGKPGWGPGWARKVARDRMFGLDFVHATLADAARELVAAAAFGERLTAQFVEAHGLVTANRDPHYRAALNSADLLFADGNGMRLAAILTGVELGDNLNATALFPELCREAAAMTQPIYLLGAKPGIAETAAAEMKARYPDLQVAGTRDGYWHHDDEAALIDEINASGARIVLVALGVPLQEKWIARFRKRLSAPLVAGVGGLFDYYSAPSPARRLFARYMIGNA